MDDSESEVTETNSQAALAHLFDERSEAFLLSLERVVQSVGGDRFVTQMFQDEESALFVSNRICEITYHVLTDAREDFVKSLIERVKAVEAFFGKSKAQQIIGIGHRLIEMTSQQTEIEAEQRDKIKILQEQLETVQAELSLLNGDATSKDLKQILSNFKDFCGNTRLSITEMTNAFHVTMTNTLSELELWREKAKDNIRKSIHTETSGDDKEKLVKRLEGAAKLVREKDAKIASLKEKLLTARQNDVVAELEVVKQKLAKAVKVIRENEDELEALRTKITKMSVVIREKDALLSELKNENESLKTNVTSSEPSSEQLQKKIRRAVRLINERDSEIERLKTAEEQKKSVQRELRNKIEAAKAAIKQRNERIRELEAMVDSSQSEVTRSAKLERSLAKAKQIVTERDETIQEQTREIEKLKMSLQLSKKGGSPGHMSLSELDDSQEMNEKSREHPESFGEDLLTSDAIMSVLDSAQLTGNARNIVKKALVAARQRIVLNKRALDELSNQNARLRRQRSKQEDHLVQLEEQISHDDEVIAHSREAGATIQEQHEMICELKSALQRQQECSRKAQDCDRLVEHLEQQCRNLVSQNSELGSELESLQEELWQRQTQSQRDASTISQLSAENQRLRVSEGQLRSFVSEISEYVDGSTLEEILDNLAEITDVSRRMGQSLAGFDDVNSLVRGYEAVKQREMRLEDLVGAHNADAIYEAVSDLKSQAESDEEVLKELAVMFDVRMEEVQVKISEVAQENRKFRDREARFMAICGEGYGFEKVISLLEQDSKQVSRGRAMSLQRLKNLTHAETEDEIYRFIRQLQEFHDAVSKNYSVKQDSMVIEIINREHKLLEKFGITDLNSEMRTIVQEYESNKRLAKFANVQQCMKLFRQLWEQEQSLKRTLHCEGSIVDEVKTLQKNSKGVQRGPREDVNGRILDQVKDILLVKNVAEIPDKIREIQARKNSVDIASKNDLQQLRDIKEALDRDSSDDVLSCVIEHKTAQEELKRIFQRISDFKEITEVSEIFGVVDELLTNERVLMESMNTTEITETVHQIVEERDEFEHTLKDIADIVGASKDHDLTEKVQAISDVSEQRENILMECLDIINTQLESELVERLRLLVRNEQEVMDVLKIETPDAIVDEITSMKDCLDEISSQVHSVDLFSHDSESGLIETTRNVCQEFREMRKLVDSVCEQVSVNSNSIESIGDEIEQKFHRMKEMENAVDNLLDKAGEIFSNPEEVFDKTMELVQIVQDAGTLMKCESHELVTGVKDLLERQTELESFILKCQSVVESSDPEDLISKLQELHDVVQSLCSLFSNSSPSDLTGQVQALLEESESHRRVIAELLSISGESEETLALECVKEMQNTQDKLMKITNTSDFSIVEDTFAALEALRKSMNFDLDVSPKTLADSVVEQANEQKKIIESMEKLLTSGDDSDILDSMKELSDIISRTLALLSIDDRTQIVARIEGIVKVMKSIFSLLATNEEGVIDSITRLKGDNAKLTGILRRIEKVIDCQKTEDVVAAMQQLKTTDNKIKDLLPGNAIDQIRALINDKKKIARMLGCKSEDELAGAIESLKKQTVEHDKLLKKLQSLTKCESESTAIGKIQQLITDDGKIRALLETQPDTSSVDAVRGMVQTMKKIMTAFRDDPEPNVASRVMEMKKLFSENEKCLDSLRKATNTNTNTDMVKVVNQILSDVKKMEASLETEPGKTLSDKIKQVMATLQRLMSLANVSSSKDLPNALTDMQKQLSMLKSLIERIAESGDDTDPCDKLKAITAERKKIQTILKLDEGEDISEKVKSLVDSINRITAKVPDSDRDLADTIENLTKLVDAHKRMMDVLESALSVTGEDAVSRMATQLGEERTKLDDILKDIPGMSIPEKVMAIKNALTSVAESLDCEILGVAEQIAPVKKHQDLLNRLRDVTNVREDEDIEESIKALTTHRDNMYSILGVSSLPDAEEQIKSLHEIVQGIRDRLGSTDTDESNVLDEIGAMQAILKKCHDATNQENDEAMVETVQELAKMEKDTKELLGLQEDDSVLARLKNMKICLNDISGHLDSCGVNDDDTTSGVRAVCSEVLTLRNFIDGVMDQLELPTASSLDEKCDAISRRIQDLVEQGISLEEIFGASKDFVLSDKVAEIFEKLKQIDECVPSSRKGDVVDKVKALVEEFDQIRDAVHGEQQPMSTLNKVRELCSEIEQLKDTEDKLKEFLETKDIISGTEEVSQLLEMIKDKLEVKNKNQIQDKLEELLEFERRICEGFHGTKKNQIPESIETLKEKHEDYEKQLGNIARALSVKTFEQIEDKLSDYAKVVDQTGKILRVTDPHEIIERVKSIAEQTNALAKALKTNDLVGATQANLEELKDLRAIVSRTMSVLKLQSKDALVASVTDICNQLRQFQDKTKTLKSILKDEDVVGKAKELSECIGKFRDLLGTDDLIDSLKRILAREKEMNRLWNSKTTEETIAKLKDVYVTLSKSDNIPQSVKALVEQIRTHKTNETKILDLLPNNLSDDVVKEVALLVNLFNDLQKSMDTLQELTSTGTCEEAVDAVDDMMRTLGFIKKALGDTEDPVSSLRELLKEKKKIAELVELENGPNGDVESLVKCYASSSSFLCHVLSILTRTNVKLTFPMTESAKSQYAEFATHLVDEHDEIANEKRAVMKRARAQGYLERGTLEEAVDVIVSTEVGNEKQKILEEMHAHAQNVRLIQEKERKGFEKSKEAYKQTIEELRAQISEMQERNLAKDEQRHDEIAEHKSSTVEMERKYEREKRIHEELMRLLKNSIVDFAFLQSNLPREEFRTIEKYRQK